MHHSSCSQVWNSSFFRHSVVAELFQRNSMSRFVVGVLITAVIVVSSAIVGAASSAQDDGEDGTVFLRGLGEKQEREKERLPLNANGSWVGVTTRVLIMGYSKMSALKRSTINYEAPIFIFILQLLFRPEVSLFPHSTQRNRVYLGS